MIEFPSPRASADGRVKRFRLRGLSQGPRLKWQIERVTALLEEIDDIAGRSDELPPAMLERVRADIGKAEQMLRRRGRVRSLRLLVEEEHDTQPNVDREMLERAFLFREPHQ